MVVIPWSWVLIGRDILVAIFAVVVVWFVSLLIRFGDDIDDKAEKKWVSFLLLIAFVALLFNWGVVAVR